jgi:hypothetical protein
MLKLAVLFLVTLLTLGFASTTQARKTNKAGYGAVVIAPSPSPEAAAMKNAQRMWPNTPLCDDGGYRIRPCNMRDGGARR